MGAEAAAVPNARGPLSPPPDDQALESVLLQPWNAKQLAEALAGPEPHPRILSPGPPSQKLLKHPQNSRHESQDRSQMPQSHTKES